MEHEHEEGHLGRCLECGDEIEYGRPDRKFCSITCKNRYNNRRHKDGRLSKLRVITALNKNYKILDDMLKLGLTEMNLLDIRHLGFNTEFMTSCIVSRGRQREYCCFDIRYHLSDTRVSSIIRM